MKSVIKPGMLVLVLALVFGLIVPAGAMAAEVIKIGVIYPLTGGAAAAGRG